MHEQGPDGQIDLYVNADRTQAFANVHPPQRNDIQAVAADLAARLGRLGVAYGIRLDAILGAIQSAADTGRPVTGVVVAEGLLPVAATDTLVEWLIPEDMVTEALPRREGGLPDYFAFEPSRLVTAGQPLAAITPGSPGIPGRTLGRPSFIVAPKPGKPPAVLPGKGVRASPDGTTYIAETTGFLEVANGHVMVHSMRLVEGSIAADRFELNCGAIIHGDVTATSLFAGGTVAIQGDCAEARIRARGDVVITRAARSTIIADGDVYVLGGLLHCDVNTRRRIIALDDAPIFGGTLAAREGLESADLGSRDYVSTRVAVGVDRWTGVRLQEVEEEIRAAELNVQKIAQALRSMSAIRTEPLSESKRRLVQTIGEQRTHLETRMDDLRGIKRSLMMAAKSPVNGSVNVSGIAYPGVHVTIRNASIAVESELSCVSFHETEAGRVIVLQGKGERAAA